MRTEDRLGRCALSTGRAPETRARATVGALATFSGFVSGKSTVCPTCRKRVEYACCTRHPYPEGFSLSCGHLFMVPELDATVGGGT